MKITRRTLAATATALFVLPGAALAQPRLSAGHKALVDKAVAYLEGLTQAKGRFVQPVAYNTPFDEEVRQLRALVRGGG